MAVSTVVETSMRGQRNNDVGAQLVKPQDVCRLLQRCIVAFTQHNTPLRALFSPSAFSFLVMYMACAHQLFYNVSASLHTRLGESSNHNTFSLPMPPQCCHMSHASLFFLCLFYVPLIGIFKMYWSAPIPSELPLTLVVHYSIYLFGFFHICLPQYMHYALLSSSRGRYSISKMYFVSL